MSSKKRNKKNKIDYEKKMQLKKEQQEQEERELDELEKIISQSGESDEDTTAVNDEDEKEIEDINVQEDSTSEDMDYLDDETDDSDKDDFFAELDRQDEKIKTFKERRPSKKSKKNSVVTEYIKKIQKSFNGNAKYAIWASIITVLFIALIIALAVDASNKNDNNNKKTTAGQLSTNNQQINELIVKYYNSMVACDMTALSEVVDSTEGISEDVIKTKSEYIESYDNISCYIKSGIKDDEYVVYVYYENKILNIKTLAPGADILYVKYNPETKKYMIHNGIKDTKIANLISKQSKESDIKKFNEKVNTKFEKACSEDADLKAFYDALMSASQSSKAEEQTTVAETTQPAEQTPAE